MTNNNNTVELKAGREREQRMFQNLIRTLEVDINHIGDEARDE